jgi:5S rRNA maturation endonuclease (ribonuclease M5)
MKDRILNYFQANYRSFYGKYLQEVKKIGDDEYKATCPFHNDENPSFNFNNQNGKYFCHGCNKKGHIFHFYAKLNDFNTKRDFPKILRGIASDFGIPWEETKKRIVATYDYLDAEGRLHSQTVRMEPKDFWQRRPDGKGGWITKDVFKTVNPILYNLPALAKASEVLIVEGEKDADNLMDLGFIATTCPMGAKKWRDGYNACLEGKDIVLIPDNDNEGREHMTQVAISLNGKAKSLKWLDLPNPTKKGYDVSNFILTFEDKAEAGERLAIMIENADPYIPPQKASLEDAILEVRSFKALGLQPKRKILNPWITDPSIALIYGWRGVGKTFFTMGIVDAITKGKSFGPWEIVNPVSCLFLDGEMPVQDIDKRLDNSDRKESYYVYSDAYANSLGLPRAHLANESWRTKMKSILLARHIKLWVVDNIASLASGIDENKKLDWDPINAWLLELRFAGISTLMLHHESKEGKQRGTAAREDNIDISIRLKLPHDYTPEDGARFIAHFEKSRVSLDDLPLITDTEFKLMQDEGGGIVWTWGSVRRETKIEILRMLDEGLKNAEIAEALNITRAYVSKVKKQGIQDGHLTENGKLTQVGFKAICEEEFG